MKNRPQRELQKIIYKTRNPIFQINLIKIHLSKIVKLIILILKLYQMKKT